MKENSPANEKKIVIGAVFGATFHPVDGSKILRCNNCNAPTLVSPVSQGYIKDGAVLWCIPCFQARPRHPDDRFETMPGQREEFEAHRKKHAHGNPN